VFVVCTRAEDYYGYMYSSIKTGDLQVKQYSIDTVIFIVPKIFWQT